MSSFDLKLKFCGDNYLNLTEYVVGSVFFVLAVIPYIHGIIYFWFDARKTKNIMKLFSVSFIIVGILYMGSLVFSGYEYIFIINICVCIYVVWYKYIESRFIVVMVIIQIIQGYIELLDLDVICVHYHYLYWLCYGDLR